ncbi:MAG: hypothetical protein LUG99_23655 [Lachnospiraceae bacterium]|nr:hypothetical protein [Lachnospiraceae bacterium]
MDFVAVIGLIGSFVTLEEAGRSWITIIKNKIRKKGISVAEWDSDDPVVQSCLDKFKSSMGEVYGEYIFSDSDIEEIIETFFSKNSFVIGYEERKQIEKFIKELIDAYNVYTKSQMSTGEKVIHNEMASDYLKIMDKLDDIQRQPEKENIKKFLRAVEKSKEIELDNIEGYINGEYEIDRTSFIEKIQRDSSRIISIQGNAGSGKSVICKMLLCNEKFVLATRAENLASERSINEIWDCDVEEAIQWLGMSKLYIFVDAIEFIADCGNRAIFSLQELYRLAEKYANVFVLTSCRSTDNSSFMKIDTKYKTSIYEIPELTNKEIDDIANKYPIIKSLQRYKMYSDLLSLPFYINLIISGGFVEENISDENSFRLLIWEKILCLREKCYKYNITQSEVKQSVERIVFTRAKKFVVGVDDDIIDSKVLNALRSEGVIINNGNGIRLKYDIFEDICFERYIDKQFDACLGNYNKFFAEIEKLGRCVYRRYQIWIANKLFVQSSREKFIYSLVTDKDISEKWKIQTEIGIVKSKYCGLFFDEFKELLDKPVIAELINVTNLYAFEAKITYTPVLSLDVKPIGAAREYLINIALDSVWKEEVYKESLIKMCEDYANYSYKSVDIEKKTCAIIIGYINDLIEMCEKENAYIHSKEIVNLFLIISKMARASKQWLTEFVENMIAEYSDDTNRFNRVAEDVLAAIVKNVDIQFVLFLPELACKSAEALWTQRKSKRHFLYDEYDINNVKAYGLSEQSDYYSNNENGVFSNPFIWHIIQVNFVKGLDWAISFVNNAIDCFAQSSPDEIYKIEIYFVDKKEKKTYWGNEQLWLTNTMDHIIPVVLADIIYVIKKTIVNTFKNSTDIEYVKKLAEYIKKTIYEKSNNIMLLSIIETIGMNFEKELPGYAIGLASSMELIYWDIRRYGQYLKNPTRELLEKQIMMTVGIPEFKSRYDKDEKCAKHLQQYMLETYLYGDVAIKAKCIQILDYLYELYDEKNYPNENLQIQKMDLRNASVTRVDEKKLMIEPKIQGEAEKILDENEKTNKPVKEVMDSISPLVEDAKNCTIDINKMVIAIDDLIAKMQQDDSINMQFEDILIVLIVSALSRDDLLREQRNHLLDEWLKRIDKIFNNGSYISNVNIISKLWEQLDKDIDRRIHDHILRIMLDSLLEDGHNGLIGQISNSVVLFLRINKKYARCFFGTIIKLAEDEMNHQKYNAEYIKKNRGGEDYEFIPNMAPKLRGVDYYISEKQEQPYESNKELIIQTYLFEGCEVDVEYFDIDNYDIGIMCYLPRCGLNLNHESFAKIIKVIIQCMIDFWHANIYETRAHKIIDTFSEHYVSSYFQYELNITGNDASLVYDILFKDVDFEKFTADTVEFYQDIFGGFLSAYVDGFRENGKRTDIETKIHKLEIYVEGISSEWVRKELKKSLFLAATRYNRWDVDKVVAKYSIKDTSFINMQICKYGTEHLKDVLYTVYMLNIDALLPEILKSLGVCFKNTISQNEKYFFETIQDARQLVDKIILKAFVKYGDEIKKDEKLIEAYEDVLLALVKVRSEKAAVLLDEFRVH